MRHGAAVLHLANRLGEALGGVRVEDWAQVAQARRARFNSATSQGPPHDAA